MTIKNSSLASQAKYIYNLKFGDLFFYDDFLITEIYEGMTIGSNEFNYIFILCLEVYGPDKPYGIVSHRLFSYSVNIFELIPISNKFKVVIANAVVAYTDFSLKNFELEKQLLKFEGKFFNNLDSGITWIKKEIKKRA